MPPLLSEFLLWGEGSLGIKMSLLLAVGEVWLRQPPQEVSPSPCRKSVGCSHIFSINNLFKTHFQCFWVKRSVSGSHLFVGMLGWCSCYCIYIHVASTQLTSSSHLVNAEENGNIFLHFPSAKTANKLWKSRECFWRQRNPCSFSVTTSTNCGRC